MSYFIYFEETSDFLGHFWYNKGQEIQGSKP
ncbi:hypothetical protein SGO_0187 [Streptococcus gordonii str. Challis substr. CH1]|uniref:Uncharacterized protein n=1 Tax=Streptococcus gordonii (strain Challis / ATCC 35105 / BCRC 15272 / CH1 / DL1 / V288) TaxID=467705 RepID=A8AUP8_STRGC|nr:hypothetical protein SGO_0187 [Streptococcus gordonii str. Challis substr. CH1]